MVQASFADSGTGLHTALAMVAAYVKKLRTGEGEYIEASMQEAVTFFMKTAGLATWGTAAQARLGNRRGAPSGIYRCKGEEPNDYIFLVTVTSRQWDTLCAAIGQPELASDERFASPVDRMANDEELRAIVGEWCAARTKYEAMHELAVAGVPCSAVLDTLDLHTDPHLVARGLVRTVEHPAAGPVRLMRNPVLAEGSLVPLTAAPMLGADTAHVLRSYLGLDDGEIERLGAAGVVGLG
jgi:formyl-CoA transferase